MKVSNWMEDLKEVIVSHSFLATVFFTFECNLKLLGCRKCLKRQYVLETLVSPICN